jgi:hypothetical protein
MYYAIKCQSDKSVVHHEINPIHFINLEYNNFMYNYFKFKSDNNMFSLSIYKVEF